MIIVLALASAPVALAAGGGGAGGAGGAAGAGSAAAGASAAGSPALSALAAAASGPGAGPGPRFGDRFSSIGSWSSTVVDRQINYGTMKIGFTGSGPIYGNRGYNGAWGLAGIGPNAIYGLEGLALDNYLGLGCGGIGSSGMWRTGTVNPPSLLWPA